MISIFKEKKAEGFEWIDITSPEKSELNDIAIKYDLHKSLVEDSMQPEHLPKFETIGETHFIILRVFSSKAPKEADTIQEVTDKVAVFIGSNFIITIHRREYEFLNEVKLKYAERSTNPYQILFRIINASLATYTIPISELARELDVYEPKIFLQEKSRSLLKNLYYIKRKASVIDFILDLSRSIIDSLKGKITPTHYSQLKDEVLRLHTNTKQVIDNVANLLNIYISLSSQRTNEVMRVLTIFSVFFMPLTFIVGIYGMNFDFMPELRWEYGYQITLIVMVLITIAIFIWFKRKGWL